MEIITVSLDEKTAETLQDKKQRTGKPVSFMVRRCLQQADLNEI